VRGVQRAAEEHQQIDVGVQAEMPASVAPEREHDRLGRVAERVGEQLSHQIVDRTGVSRQRVAAGLPARCLSGELLACGREPRAPGLTRVGVRFGAAPP